MKREKLITEHLVLGILDTEKPLVYGVLNTANYDVMGYVFLAGVASDCLRDVGCSSEDIEKADVMGVGDILYAEWPAEKAVLIVKMKDDRFTAQE